LLNFLTLQTDKTIFLKYSNEGAGSFTSRSLNIASGSESGMDDLFFNRMLSEWLRDRLKKQVHTEIVSLKEF
jgi:hypothetical protein